MWVWQSEYPKECSLCGCRLRRGNCHPTCGYCYEAWCSATCWKNQRRQWINFGQWEQRRQPWTELPAAVDEPTGEGGGSSEGSFEIGAVKGKGKRSRGKGKGKGKKGQK